MSLKDNKRSSIAILLSGLVFISSTVTFHKNTPLKPPVQNPNILNTALSSLFLLDVNQGLLNININNSIAKRNTRYKLSSRGLPSLGIASEEAFVWPVGGSRKIGSPFGKRGAKFHLGIDILGKKGMPIVAARSGRVVFAGEKPEYGKCIIINNGNGLKTLYAHAAELDVQVGDDVKAGQTIAKIGMTGNATGPHLHFEVRINDEAKNPEKYL